ncbi:hypothetical protein Nepgr_028179 [Nepenthes gracilis]|uniref:Uncharacterized protein n=1 Tax=Nepenthes gracilis TaxID=150966 RepID=A0AAD3TBY8_NEPGR|nr:hypothetical protein Nepgr_028179 [Nepenthes gracilis]
MSSPSPGSHNEGQRSGQAAVTGLMGLGLGRVRLREVRRSCSKRYNHQVEFLAHDHCRLRVLSSVGEGCRTPAILCPLSLWLDASGLPSTGLSLWVAAGAYWRGAMVSKAVPRPPGVRTESWDGLLWTAWH